MVYTLDTMTGEELKHARLRLEMTQKELGDENNQQAALSASNFFLLKDGNYRFTAGVESNGRTTLQMFGANHRLHFRHSWVGWNDSVCHKIWFGHPPLGTSIHAKVSTCKRAAMVVCVLDLAHPCGSTTATSLPRMASPRMVS